MPLLPPAPHQQRASAGNAGEGGGDAAACRLPRGVQRHGPLPPLFRRPRCQAALQMPPQLHGAATRVGVSILPAIHASRPALLAGHACKIISHCAALLSVACRVWAASNERSRCATSTAAVSQAGGGGLCQETSRLPSQAMLACRGRRCPRTLATCSQSVSDMPLLTACCLACRPRQVYRHVLPLRAALLQVAAGGRGHVPAVRNTALRRKRLRCCMAAGPGAGDLASQPEGNSQGQAPWHVSQQRPRTHPVSSPAVQHRLLAQPVARARGRIPPKCRAIQDLHVSGAQQSLSHVSCWQS